MTDNEQILGELKDKLSKLATETLYKFNNMTYQEKCKWYDEMLFAISKDPTITSEINHTKFPDDSILVMLNNNGVKLDNIHDLISVDSERVDDGINYGYQFKITFSGTTNRKIIECNINTDNKEGYNAN